MAQFDSPLYNIVGSFDSPLFNKAVSHDSPLYFTAESLSKIENISVNSKPNLKLFYVNFQGPRWSCFMERNGGEKSHDTVPLKMICPNPNSTLGMWSSDSQYKYSVSTSPFLSHSG